MPNFDNALTEGFIDVRRNNRTLGVLNGTQTVANQCQINGPNTGFRPVASVEVGQIVDIVSPTGTVRGTERTITALSGTTTITVTYSGADIGTDANGDLIVLTASQSPIGSVNNMNGVGAVDTALNGANGTYFSQANLDKMTDNDKIYAARLQFSPGSLG